MKRMMAAMAMMGLIVGPGWAENIVFPPDAGVVNVKQAPYNAHGDGVHDDTAAIQQAISDTLNGSKIVYLPNGTYRVSDRLQWRKGTTGFSAGWGAYLTLQGQSQAGTVIKLQDRCPGYADPASPRAVVYTASRDDQNAYDDATGPGNQAFANFVRTLTVDVGAGNPGAVGIDYQVSNWGALRDVTVKTSDPKGAGYAGVSMTRRDNGPGLVKNVSVQGFQYGVKVADGTYHLTFENISLRGQSVGAIQDDGMPLSLHGLTSVNRVPALRITGTALVDLLGATLTGGDASQFAIDNTEANSHLYARSVVARGYAGAVRNRGQAVPAASLTEWVSDPIKSLFPAPSHSLGLPIKETPTYTDADFTHWRSAGPPSGGDDTRQIQAALNSGRSTVYFPNGNYHVSDTLHVPPTVRHLLGLESHLLAAAQTQFTDGRPLWRFEGTGQGIVVLEGFHTEVAGQLTGVEDATTRTLVIRDQTLGGSPVSYRNTLGCGRLFLEDVLANLRLEAPQKIWARQLNDEQGDSLIVNSGATLWILGLKTERADTILEARGGQTEVLGGNIGVFGTVPSGHPLADVSGGARLSLSLVGTAFVPKFFFTTLVRETRGDAAKTLATGDAPWRGLGTNLPLFVSGEGMAAR